MINNDFILFTCVSFTWYVALQWKYIRTFLPVDVSRETKFRDNLESPLAQGDAVLRPDAHVSPVKPLHAGGAGRAAVHLGTCWVRLRAAELSLSAVDSREARCVLIHIQRAARSDWPDALPAFEYQAAGSRSPTLAASNSYAHQPESEVVGVLQ